MKLFKNDPNYLLKYCVYNTIFFFSLSFILIHFRNNLLDFSFTYKSIFLLFSTFLLWGMPSSLLHNCAHHNIKPNWLNTFTGELLGAFMLYGFKGFRLGHLYHHKFPDNPLWDPHPPKGYNFLEFVMAPVKDTLLVVERAYYQNFGKNKKTELSIKIQRGLFYLSGISRLLFWFSLFKLKFFILLYLPIYAGNIIVFAHINFATHIENSEGKFEIINLNHNLYYKIVNALSFNGYFHKSHHLKPQLFNPREAKINDKIPYISFDPKKISL